MDMIEFKLTKVKYDKFESDAVDIFINNKKFLKKIHAYERFHHINGGHVPIAIYDLYKSLAEDYLKESVPIYGCGCGDIDCSPIYIKVSVDEDSVTWDNFIFPDEFFHIKDKPRPKFRKQTFYKAQYFREVEKLKHWLFDNSAVIERDYVGKDFIGFKIKRHDEEFNFGDLLNNPISEMEKLLKFIEGGKNLPTSKTSIYSSAVFNFGKDDLNFQITAWHDTHQKVLLRFKIFHPKIYSEEINFCDFYRRNELAAMLKKFFELAK